MSDQDLKIWALEEVADPEKGNTQRKIIQEESWIQGWGRKNGVTNQQLNTLFNLLTHYSPPTDFCAYPHPVGESIPVTAIHANGQPLSETLQPVLFSVFGNNIPDLSSDNLTGFIWVFRNH